MASLSNWEKRNIVHYEQFLKRIEGWTDPTWGFHVYATYTRSRMQKDSVEENDADQVQGEPSSISFKE